MKTSVLKKFGGLSGICFFLFLGTMRGETPVVIYHDNADTLQIDSIFVQENGKIYFVGNELWVDDGVNAPHTFLVSNIRKIITGNTKSPMKLPAITQTLPAKPLLYPNPTERVLHLTGTGNLPVQITIYSMLGQPLLRQTISPEEPIDISFLSSGYYLLQTQGHTLKFCKR
ncbi:MAG: T9SS type A sorting domain-containing protein [Bacteroidales bacterium]|nr:T9SS type A sorting domain-containing protein [Bacteroidales bacterium]